VAAYFLLPEHVRLRELIVRGKKYGFCVHYGLHSLAEPKEI